MKLLFVVNSVRYFVQHRLSLAKRASASGYEVSVAAEPDDPHSLELVRAARIGFFPLPQSPMRLDPVGELRSFLALRRVLRKLQPALVHSMTIKSVVYSGILSRALHTPMLALIPGRGTAFVSGGARGKVLKWTACTLYRLALRHVGSFVCFENMEDKAFFEDLKIVDDRRSYRMMGSGVDVEKYFYTPYDTRRGAPRVVMLASRMLRNKGVLEFIASASLVRLKHPDAVFKLVGEPDPRNPESLSKEELEEQCMASGIEYLGFQRDMPRVLSQCHIFCLPSYYAEGVPVSVLEAAAMGKAVVTTDMPGCRDAVLDGQTGLLVRPRSACDLAEAIIKLIDSPELCAVFASKGRRRVEQLFRDDEVHRRYLEIYAQLVSHPDGGHRSAPRP